MKQQIFFIALTGSLLLLLFITSASKPPVSGIEIKSETNYSTEKLEAYRLIKVRCNSCHTSRNPRRVFTLENMSDYADKINTQVFIKKRMPKGRNNTLSTTEQRILKSWLNQEKL